MRVLIDPAWLRMLDAKAVELAREAGGVFTVQQQARLHARLGS
ncbi:hypothetical protein GCM10023081_32610 [Arthrobacter ginkgonis]|uniref:Uncharacterized protein n=1 Tax=Arthrobacter ginkgonis TaxID=1630594 RepID=A0ABP7CL66_9MICC